MNIGVISNYTHPHYILQLKYPIYFSDMLAIKEIDEVNDLTQNIFTVWNVFSHKVFSYQIIIHLCYSYP